LKVEKKVTKKGLLNRSSFKTGGKLFNFVFLVTQKHFITCIFQWGLRRLLHIVRKKV
jgi:hypothetical protein